MSESSSSDGALASKKRISLPKMTFKLNEFNPGNRGIRMHNKHCAHCLASMTSGVHDTHEERVPIIDGLGRAPPRPVQPGI